MTLLPARFEATLRRMEITGRKVLLAVSGGPDSLALLELTALVRERLDLEPVVGHLDHGIHPDSAAVALAVRRHAERHGFPIRSGQAGLGPEASETEAREARHQWFEQAAADLDATILTAHHEDDQLETMVMRFLEGSGPLGLSGIAEVRGPWVRPLLSVARADLAAFLTERRVEPAWDDPSNRDPRHLRGWTRATLLPAIRERLPRVRENLLLARRMFEDNRSAWSEVMEVLPGIDLRVEADGASVAADRLAGYGSAVVRSLLQALGRRVGIPVGRGQLDRMQAMVGKGVTGRNVDLSGGAVAELAYGRLRLFRPVAHPAEYDVPIDGPGSFKLGGWSIESVADVGPAGLERVAFRTWFPAGVAPRVRNWRSGDRIRPLGGQGSRLVVRCMQDQKISRHLRPTWPIVELDGDVVWVPGVCRADMAVPDPGTEAMRMDAKSG